MKSREEYIDSLSLELKHLSAQIDVLADKADIATEDMKKKYNEELYDLRIKKHAAAEKIKELQESSGDAWETVKETTDKLWEDLKTGVNSAIARFQ
jgi:uncharacterized protein YoxC